MQSRPYFCGTIQSMKIINIGNRILNNYLVETAKGWVAVDTGYPGGWPRFLVGLRKNGIEPRDIKFIFLTHTHDDHAGYLGELMAATGAIVVMSELAPERLLAGHNRWAGGSSGRLAKLFVSAMSLAGKGKHEFPAIDMHEAANVVLWDGRRQFFKDHGLPLTIVSLPGHTADNIGLLTDDGALFCGDAAMNGFPSVRRNIIWIENLADYRRSWDTMITSPARVIYPSHGAPFPQSDLIKYRGSLEKIRLY
jgi:glyoxylase-like metal-dependent hydrolase (beta-lactamase superfamily II)